MTTSAGNEAGTSLPTFCIKPLLLDLFAAAAAARNGELIAIEAPDVRLTYRELSRRAAGFACALAPLAPEAMVAVLLPRHEPDLYAAQLGILMAGGAFACLDPKFPDAFLAQALRTAAAVVTDAEGGERLRGIGLRIVLAAEVASAAANPVPPVLAPQRLAYVIHTSGTTGAPKGVAVEHGAIANLVRADLEYFRLGPEARVAQCSSPAYDSSIEEAWLAFAAGATLVLMDDATLRLGPDLVAWLRRARISVLCPPPTLLRAMACSDPERALPDLKLLYVGGEALTPDLAERWSPGRWMENGYGPTECTVTCLRGRVRPGRVVTIGRPVAGCTAQIIEGELCIGGACLARGYAGEPALTAERFVEHPTFGRLYRTGDGARINEAGEFECLGRLDAQIKLRGYRIELEAIEAALATCPGVRAAACRVQGEASAAVLAAHIVADPAGLRPEPGALQAAVRAQLPAYMVPVRFGYLDTLPTSTAGKLDRARLPELAATAASEDGGERSVQEVAASQAFAAALGLPAGPGADADFFADLGGDSLAVTDVVVRLRGEGWSVGARDVYEAPTAAALAQRMRRAVSHGAPAIETARTRGHPRLCTVAQTAWLAMEWVLAGAVVYGAGFKLLPLLFANFAVWQATLLAMALTLAGSAGFVPLSLAWAVLLKRTLIGEYRAGRWPIWSGYYLRHWIVAHSARHVPWALLQGSEWQCAALRALGAKIGTGVHIHRGVDLSHGGWDLLTLGSDVTLGQEAAVRTVDLGRGELICGPVQVCDGATLAPRAGMEAGSVLGAGAVLGPLSWLPAGATVPAGERWDGVPAAHGGQAGEMPLPTRGRELGPNTHAEVLVGARFGQSLLAWLPWIAAALVAPGEASAGVAWWELHWNTPAGIGVAGLAAAVAVGVRLAVQAGAVRRLGRARPGIIPTRSWEAARIEMAAEGLEAAGRWLAGTLLWPRWLRAAGMRVGRGCEISTILDVTPALVELGDECFLADGMYLAPPWRQQGRMVLARTRLGRDTFVGNHAVVPSGHDWPEGMFVGVATVPPDGAGSGKAWFGAPAMALPRKREAYDRRLTHEPNAARRAARWFWELARFALPSLPVALAIFWWSAMEAASATWGDAGLAFVVAPALLLAAAAAACAAAILVKWVLLGRVRPRMHAFWSCWCGRWDWNYVAWETWAAPLLERLDGTLLLNAVLRLTGMSIGRWVVLGPGFAQIVDPDMLRIGDGATVSCHILAHTFEDRMLKLGYIQVGPGASAGDGAVVLHHTEFGAGAELEPQSVLMKGDRVPDGERFAGAPARAVRTREHVDTGKCAPQRNQCIRG